MSPRRSPRRWPLVLAVLVLGGGAVAFGDRARPSPPAQTAAQTVPISASVRVCPATGEPPVPGTTTYLSAASLPASALPVTVPAAQPPSDGLRLTPLSGSGPPLATVTSPGSQATYTATAGLTTPTALRASGVLAPGAGASQVTYVPHGPHRALIGSSCPAPTGNAWFVGASGATGRLATVELDNPDPTPAVADIVVYGEHGMIVAPAGRGVTVPPHGDITRRVDVLAPGTALVGLHVVLREGRAAVSVSDEQTIGLLPRGADLVPEAAAPSRRVVIPGVPGGQTGSRTLQILVPGPQDAIVRVQVLSRDQRFTPDNLAALDVPAGSVGKAELLSQVGDGSVALLITSDEPIVAGVRNVLPSPNSTPDVTYSAATRSLRTSVVVAGLQMGNGWVSRMFLAAPSTRGQVTIALIKPDGSSSAAVVDLVGGTSDELVLRGPQSFVAVVSPDVTGGPVFGSASLDYQDTLGQLATEWPLLGTPTTVTLPVVRADAALGVPGN
jgi:Family of unknown function (DUF5719)